MSKYAEQRAALDALYAELPTLECKGECWESCGPIFMTQPEWLRIRRYMKQHRGIEKIPKPGGDLMCPMLMDHRCQCYSARPLICRLWGIVETLPCPWGCKPNPRYLTHAEGYEYIVRAEMIADPRLKEENEKLLELIKERPDLVKASSALVHTPIKTH